MTTYRVVYAIDVEADSPREAAFHVERLLRSDDPDRFRPILDVYEWRQGNTPRAPLDGSRAVTIDLDDLNSEETRHAAITENELHGPLR